MGPWLPRKTDRKSQIADRFVQFQWPWVILKDGMRWFIIFRHIYVKMLVVFDISDRIRHGNSGGGEACLNGSVTSLPKKPPIAMGGSPASPNFWDLLRARAQYEKQHPKFCTVIKLHKRKIFFRVDHALCPGQKKFLVTRMLTRDLFAVDNLVVEIDTIFSELWNLNIWIWILPITGAPAVLRYAITAREESVRLLRLLIRASFVSS